MGKPIWEGVIRDLKKRFGALFNSKRGFLSGVVWGYPVLEGLGPAVTVEQLGFIDNFFSRLSLFSYCLNVTVSKIH